MSDERIQELWVMAYAVKEQKQPVHVHLFPTHKIEALLENTQDEELVRFWTNLAEGLNAFEETRILPKVSVDRQGTYHFE